MSAGRGRIFVCNKKHLCVDASVEKSSTCCGVPLQSAVQSLSVRLIDGKEDRQRKRRRALRMETAKITIGTSAETRQLERSHSRLQLTNDMHLNIWKIKEGVYLIAHETWENVKYLQVSNVDGYAVAFGGVFLVPSIQQLQTDGHHLLSSLVHNSLWTNGKEVLNNVGTLSMTRNEDLNVDVPSIELDATYSHIDEPAPSSSWRLCIERALQQTTVNRDEYAEQELRVKRREYLLRRSLEVLNEVVDEHETT
jgi:hypothetical protein